MSTIAAIVRLRWTLTISVLRRSVLQTIGYCLLLTMGVGAVVGAARLAAVLGAPGAADHAGFTPACCSPSSSSSCSSARGPR